MSNGNCVRIECLRFLGALINLFSYVLLMTSTCWKFQTHIFTLAVLFLPLQSAFSHIQFICQCMGKAIQGTFYNVMVLRLQQILAASWRMLITVFWILKLIILALIYFELL